MCTSFLQGPRHLNGVSIEQQRSNCSNRIKTHPSRCTGSENAKHQLFEKSRVSSFTPNVVKLTEPFSYLFPSSSMSRNYSFDCDGFLFALHFSLSITGFYERLMDMSTSSF